MLSRIPTTRQRPHQRTSSSSSSNRSKHNLLRRRGQECRQTDRQLSTSTAYTSPLTSPHDTQTVMFDAFCMVLRPRSVQSVFSVRLSSETFVHPTQAIEIFGHVSTPCGTLAILDLCIKILRRSSQGNPFVEG